MAAERTLAAWMPAMLAGITCATNDSDYATFPFKAEITFELSTAISDNGTPNDPLDDFVVGDTQAVFFGIGAGDRALFGTPDWSTLFSSASFWPEAANDKFVRFRTFNDMNNFADTNVAGLDAGTHRFRMTFNPASNLLLGEIDINYAGGPFVADPMLLNFPINTAALFGPDGWPNEPSRIFFGGDDGVVFRDLSIMIIPEPSAGAILLISAAVMICGRRTGKR